MPAKSTEVFGWGRGFGDEGNNILGFTGLREFENWTKEILNPKS